MSKKEQKSEPKSLEALLNDDTVEVASSTDLSASAPAKEKKPFPGSPDAIKAGCTCPIYDNKKGEGAWINTATKEPMFWVSDTCSLHAAK
jgi:hypothetical protein